MASAVIGALRVNLSADTAAFSRGLTNATRQADRFGTAITGRLTAQLRTLGLAFAAVAGPAAIGLMVRSSINAVSAQVDLANRIGASVAAVQTLEFAAQQAGVSTSAFTQAVGMLNLRLAEATREGAGNAFEAFKRLGLSLADLSAMDADQRIVAIADALDRMGLSAGQQQETLRQLGIRNQEVVNLFQEGAPAIQAAREQLEKWGAVMSDQDARNLEAAGDAIDRVGQLTREVGNQIAIGLTPQINALATRFDEAEGAASFFRNAAVAAANDVARAIAKIVDFIRTTTKEVALMGAAFQRLALGAARVGDVFFDNSERVNTLNAELGETLARIDAINTGPSATEEVDALIAAADGERRLIEAKAELAAQMQAAGMVGGARPGVPGTTTVPPITDAGRTAAEEAAAEAAARLEALREELVNENTILAEHHADQLAELQKFYEAGALSKAEYDEMRANSEEEYRRREGELRDEAARLDRIANTAKIQGALAVAGAITGALTTLFKENKAMAIADVIVSTAAAIMKTYEMYGWSPMGIAGAISAAAAGIAQLQAIRSTSKGGGGSIAGAQGSQAQGAQISNRTLFISGIKDTEFYSGDKMRGLANALIEYQRDGGQVVLR